MRLVIAELRKIRDISQEKLAELSGLHRSTIARIEIQNVGWTHKTLKTFASALRCEAWELLGYSYPPDIQLSASHRELLSVACKVDERAAKLLVAHCNAMIEAGMARQSDAGPVKSDRRGPGRPCRNHKRSES